MATSQKANITKATTSNFWTKTIYIFKLFGPLVRVLRLVDDRAKEIIIKSFGENEDKYKKVFEIIDKRWESQLHHILHAAGHYLNLEFFYSNSYLSEDLEVMNGLYQVMQRLLRTRDEQQKVMNQLLCME
uniref:DUF4371 domain-containing protein n=1 Tax=Manihot esculenta TaxID=3983 RepID=A0A2C9U539_MANES